MDMLLKKQNKKENPCHEGSKVKLQLYISVYLRNISVLISTEEILEKQTIPLNILVFAE